MGGVRACPGLGPASWNRHRGVDIVSDEGSVVSFAGSPGSGGYTPASAPDAPPTVQRPGPPTPPMRRLAGRFLLEQQLRVTPGADIWLALDEKLNRSVAVYLMSSGATSTSEVLSAARLAAGVPDTRFVQVLDAVEDGTSAYVVTEWLIDAVDLATTLADGPITSWEAVALARDVAEAMACAHAAGLTHLRLDPYNVLRTESGQVKIHGLRLDAVLSGLVPASVEDARTADVRGIGALLYAALTGHWPWGEGYGLAAAPQDSLGPVTPATLRTGIPPDVDSVTMRLLSAGVPLPDATPPAPAPSDGEEETLTVPRLPVATCDDAVEALVELRPVRPRPPTAPQPQYPQPDADPPRVGAGQGYQPTYRYGPDPGPARRADDTGIVRHGPGIGSGRQSGRSRAPLAATVVLTLVASGVGLLGWQLASRGNKPPVTPTASASQAQSAPAQLLQIRDASLWQASTDDEHSDTVDNTITGKSPAWRTSGYNDGPKLALKQGTGIIYDLGAVRSVSHVTVKIGHAGATVELRAADPDVPDVPEVRPRVAPPGFRVVRAVDATGTEVVLRSETPVRTRFVLVWFTALPYVGSVSGGGGGPYRDSISLVQVYGTP